MTEYLVMLAFDLRNASSSHYQQVDEALQRIGLTKTVVGDDGTEVDLPFNTYGGTFTGVSGPIVRDQVHLNANMALSHLKLNGRLFVSVGADWAWVSWPV